VASPTIQSTFGTPYTLPPLQRFIDAKSPLFKGLQSAPSPSSYKPITLPKFNGKTDPQQFIMSFEAATAFAGGNDTVLAKSFVIGAEGNALAWYSMFRPKSVYSWEDLHDKIMANFKGFSRESLTSSNLFQCRQQQGETLREYYQKFVQLKARAPNVPKDVAIEEAIKGLRIRAFIGPLTREKPSTIEELNNEFEKYYISDNDLHKRLEEQAQYKQAQSNNRNTPRDNRGQN
jgi:hypothetical protein